MATCCEGSSLPMVPAAVWHGELVGGTSEATVSDAGFALCRFNGTPRAVAQPPLVEDILCIHGGGAKRVHRHHGHSHSVHDIDCGALTLMPREHQNQWLTFGPIDYVHLTPTAELIETIAADEFASHRDYFEFHDDVGFRDPLVEMLIGELLLCANRASSSRLYADGLLTALVGRLVLTRSTLSSRRLSEHGRMAMSACKGGLPGWRLRRILEYLHEHLADEISLVGLSDIAGLSRAQFFRAFRQSTGTTPARYLEDMRIERGRELLAGGAGIDAVATTTGFSSVECFNAAFRRSFGQTAWQFVRSNK